MDDRPSLPTRPELSDTNRQSSNNLRQTSRPTFPFWLQTPADLQPLPRAWSAGAQQNPNTSSTFSNISASGHSRQHNGHNHNTTTNNNNYSASGSSTLHNGHNYTTATTITNNYSSQQRLPDAAQQKHERNQDLLQAAGEGHTQRVEILIKDGAEVRYTDREGLTALHYAVLSGYPDTVETLWKLGARVNAQSTNFGAPLCFAALRGSLEMTELLLSRHRAYVNIPGRYIGTPLHCASYVGNLDIVEKLLREDPQPHVAQGIRLDILEKIHDNGHRHQLLASLLDGTSLIGKSTHTLSCSPLTLACISNHAQLVQVLLDHGASATFERHAETTVPGTIVEETSTALIVASELGNMDVLCQLLQASLDINEQNSDGRTALHMAAKMGFLNCVQALLAAGSQIDCVDHDNNTPLQLATAAGHEEVARCFTGLFEQNIDGSLEISSRVKEVNMEEGQTPFLTTQTVQAVPQVSAKPEDSLNVAGFEEQFSFSLNRQKNAEDKAPRRAAGTALASTSRPTATPKSAAPPTPARRKSGTKGATGEWVAAKAEEREEFFDNWFDITFRDIDPQKKELGQVGKKPLMYFRDHLKPEDPQQYANYTEKHIILKTDMDALWDEPCDNCVQCNERNDGYQYDCCGIAHDLMPYIRIRGTTRACVRYRSDKVKQECKGGRVKSEAAEPAEVHIETTTAEVVT